MPSETTEKISLRLWQASLSLLVYSLLGTGVAASEVYVREIQPLLQERCYRCHGPERQRGGLRLDRSTLARQGGDSGDAAVVPGDANSSLLIALVSAADEDDRMPPASAKEAPLNSEEIELLRRWIDAGAEWPEDPAFSDKASPSEMRVTDADRQHWSFLPLRRVEVPMPQASDRVRTPVDAFIRQAQEEKMIQVSPAADPRTLIRRVFYDLIGLPPSPEEMAQWMERLKATPRAFSSLVDALLESPHYGERWARHWLDVARYADSNGMELDADRPNAFRFRDFVIRALNQDLPFDTFVRWQLAGDEIAPGIPDAIAATGFLAAGVNTILPDKQMVEEKLRNRANELDDVVSTTGQALLGLTLACARCHDHKYDPLPTKDYYRLTRIFNSGDRAEVPLAAPDVVAAHQAEEQAWKTSHDQLVKKHEAWLSQVRKPLTVRLRNERIAKLDISEEEKETLKDKPGTPEAKRLAERFKKELRLSDKDYFAALSLELQNEWNEWKHQVELSQKRKPAELPKAFAFADFGPEPAETWFFERGDFLARNEKMDLGFLAVLTSGKTPEDYWSAAQQDRRRKDSTQQRRALANWMTDIDAGAGSLLARVMVNRVWQHHFREGLVGTPSDFGSRGDRPSHPKLLEWLTKEFVSSGWSVKHLHRLILNSATYQQSSEFDSERAARDPENRLLWRQRPVRLEAEAMRDAMLAVAGTLDRKRFGPAFKPPIAIEALQARNVRNPYPKDAVDSSETRRRSIYMFHKRVVQYPLMQAFDAPDAQQSCGRRMNTTVAPQALAILNDPFVRLRAEELGGRLRRECGEDLDAQVETAFQYALNRPPSAEELADARDFVLQQSRERIARGELNGSSLALVDFCHSLFGLNEFIYID